MKDVFAEYHPICNGVYFLFVIGMGMFLMHPVCLMVEFFAAFFYCIFQQGKREAGKKLFLVLPILLLTAGVNICFTHQGMTMLWYLPTGNPITLEAILYGVGAGLLLAGVIVMFSCFHYIMTSDKLMYLFGRLMPALSLLLAMIFRFVPKFSNQQKKVIMAQKGIGRSVEQGKLGERAAAGMKLLSILTTWSFETSIETADSMKSRGYGLRGRTNYVRYRMTGRDWWLLGVMGTCFLLLIYGITTGRLHYSYYPVFTMKHDPVALLFCGLYGLICFVPLWLNVWEELKWKYFKSRM